MPQSLSRLIVHIIFSTKGRQPFLADQSLRTEMHAVLGALCSKLDSPVIRVGGVADHVHIACHLGRTRAISDLIKEIKRESSKWIKARRRPVPGFEWQSGYAAFSISPTHVDRLVEYINHQEEHHRKESFQDELRRILTNYQLEWDERYLWD